MEEITYTDVLRTIAKNWWILIITVVLGFGAGYLLHQNSRTTTYAAKVEYGLKPQDSGLNDLSLTTYSDLLKSNFLMKETVNKLKKEVPSASIGALQAQLVVNRNTEKTSRIFGFTIQGGDKEDTLKTAEVLNEVFEKEAPKVWGLKNFELLSSAKDGQTTITSNGTLDIPVGILAGLVVGLVISFFRPVKHKA